MAAKKKAPRGRKRRTPFDPPAPKVITREVVKISGDLMSARKAAILQMYLDMDPPRSLPKLDPAIKNRFGGPHIQTVMKWARTDDWKSQAAKYDIQKHAATEVRAQQLIDVSTLDEVAGLRTVARKYIKLLVDAPIVPRNAQEARAIANIVKVSIETMETLLDPGSNAGRDRRNNANPQTVTNNNFILDSSGSRAKQALDILQQQIDAVQKTGKPSPVIDVESEQVEEAAVPAIEDQNLVAARDVPVGEPWAFPEHRTMAEVMAEEKIVVPDEPTARDFMPIHDVAAAAQRQNKSIAELLEERKNGNRGAA